MELAAAQTSLESQPGGTEAPSQPQDACEGRHVDVGEVRQVAVEFIKGRYVPEADLQSAQSVLRKLMDEALAYGLSEADTVKAVLAPALKDRPLCRCASCEARRKAMSGDSPAGAHVQA